jgi:hypothetical protein
MSRLFRLEVDMESLKIIKMSDIKAKPVEWLWERYIPNGAITLFQGDGGDYKTTTALALTAAVTTGRALPGSSATSLGHSASPTSWSRSLNTRLSRRTDAVTSKLCASTLFCSLYSFPQNVYIILYAQ